MDTINRIKRIVADVIDCDINEIENNSRIVDDLGADSLDIFTLIDRIEREFSVEFTNLTYSAMSGNTISAVAEQVESLQK